MQRELGLELRDLGNPKDDFASASGFSPAGFSGVANPASLDSTLPLQPVQSPAQPRDSEFV